MLNNYIVIYIILIKNMYYLNNIYYILRKKCINKYNIYFILLNSKYK